MKWKVFSKEKPKSSGIYAVVIVKKSFAVDYLYSKPSTVSPETKSVIWALWSYKELCIDITADRVIYEKVYAFFDDKQNPIADVILWTALPKIPEWKEIKPQTSEAFPSASD